MKNQKEYFNSKSVVSSLNNRLPQTSLDKAKEVISQVRENARKKEIKRTALSLSPKKKDEMESYLLPGKPRNSEVNNETLVHSTFDQVDHFDVTIPIEIEGNMFNIYVALRPGVFEFIEELSEIFEIVIFTASMSKYADPLISTLDTYKKTNYRLFREHCTYIDGVYVKDLSKLGRNLRNVILVDNSPLCYTLQPNNGIPIKSWFDDKNDRELFMLLPVLRNLAGFYDVRSEIPKFVCNNTLIFKKAFSWVEENYIIENSKLINEKSPNIKIEDRNVEVNKITTHNTLTQPNISTNNASSIRSVTPANKILNNVNKNGTSLKNILKNINKPIIQSYKFPNCRIPKAFTKTNPNYIPTKSLKKVNENSNIQTPLETEPVMTSPNININIFNGSFNNIVLTENDSNTTITCENNQINELELTYRPIKTEDNLNCKSATQNLISELKNVSGNMTTKSNVRKINLHYLNTMKKNKSNIKIVEDLQNCKEENKVRNSSLIKNTKVASSVANTSKEKKNYFNMQNLKTNFSSFLSGKYTQKILPKHSKTNTSNSHLSNSIISNLNNSTLNNYNWSVYNDKTRNKEEQGNSKHNSRGHTRERVNTSAQLTNNNPFANVKPNINCTPKLNPQKLEDMKKLYTRKLIESYKKRSTILSFANKKLILNEKKSDDLNKSKSTFKSSSLNKVKTNAGTSSNNQSELTNTSTILKCNIPKSVCKSQSLK